MTTNTELVYRKVCLLVSKLSPTVDELPPELFSLDG